MSFTQHKPLSLALLLVCVAGCDPSAPADAGTDAALDTNERPDAPRDTGPPCDLSCGATEACCYVDEVAQCTDLAANVSHCGGCNVDCIATRRGDSCENRQCACGMNDIGCTGTIDECCPAVEGGRDAHCANVRTAFEDCGTCGQACEVTEASLCRNGTCVCGESGGPCAGTPEDTCCDIGPTGNYACVNTLTSRAHCGACGRRCTLDERCSEGTCVSRFDAGPAPDAGVEDAGTDVGMEDAGPPDAGPDAE